MNKEKRLGLLCGMAALVLLGTAGCGAEPTGGGAEDQGTTMVQQALWMNYHGGSGGSPFNTAFTALDSVRVASYGTHVDQLMFQRIPDENNQRWYDGPYGQWTGSGNPWLNCYDMGRYGYVIGIFGYSDNYVNELGLACGLPDQSNLFFVGPTGSVSGTFFYDLCPSGQVVKEFYGRSGSWIDGIQIYCDSL